MIASHNLRPRLAVRRWPAPRRAQHLQRWQRVGCAALMLGWHTVAAGRAQAEDRREIPQAVSARLAAATWMGAADPDASLPVSMTLQLQHRSELDALIAEQQRPGSPDYHRWLTPEEFTARFAPDAETYDALAEWLRRQGLAVSTSPNRLRIDCTGTATQLEASFRVRMNRYRHRDRDVLATPDGPTVPAQFADLVQSARLNTLPLAQPLLQLTVSDAMVDTMAPQDMYNAYGVGPALARGIDGTGQTIAVVARSDFALSDVKTFQTDFGVPVRAPSKVFPKGNPGIGSANWACKGLHKQTLQTCIRREEVEVALDTEWAGAMAPGAAVLVDISNQDIDLSLLDVVNHHPNAKIITISFGACERLDASALQTLRPMYTQAAAQGQTVLVATGDDGSDDCQDGGRASVNALASDVNVTAVGGTALDPGFDAGGSATGYIGETVWNDYSGASGGGASILVSKPSYQSGPGVPADGFRDQPDVALLASPVSSGYIVAVANQLAIVGGTSAATPSWAGIVALLNTAAHADGLGAINASLYDLARQQYANGGVAVFHDVTLGDTTFNGVAGFSAGVGFDLATGWGSPNVELLTQAFEPPPAACIGDCDGSGAVTVDELITGVNIVLGTAPIGTCPMLACHGSGPVTVDCLIKAVNAALTGCGSQPSS